MTARQVRHASLICCAVVVFVLYGSNLGGFWRSDDTAILAHALLHPFWSNFTDPLIWQQLSASNLTPLLPSSFRVDHLVAGLQPAAFYLHQLLVVVAIGWLAFLWLQRCVHPLLAACAVLLFLLGLPVALTVSQLMTRHYLEGLLGCLLSLYALTRLQQGHSRGWLLAFTAGFLYALGAKETYVPLGLALALDTLWRRLSGQDSSAAGKPLLIAGLLTLLYILWRRWMLPDPVGAYGGSGWYKDPDYWRNAAQTFAGFPALLFGKSAALAILPCAALLALQLVLRPRSIVSLALWAGAILLPLLPLVETPGIRAADRYLLLPWFGLCCFVAFACDALFRYCQHLSEPRQALVLAAAPLAILTGCAAWRLQQTIPDLEHSMARSDTMLRFVFAESDAVSFIPDPGLAAAYWSVEYAAVLKRMNDPAASVPLMVSDDLLLDAGKPLYHYDPACRCMEDISASIPQRLAALEAAQDSDAALQIEMRNAAGVLGWNFGPYTEGQYHVVSREVGKRVLPRSQSSMRSTIYKPVGLQIKYESPEGWFTTTPVLELPADGSLLEWNRDP